jgi:hypothetical protein
VCGLACTLSHHVAANDRASSGCAKLIFSRTGVPVLYAAHSVFVIPCRWAEQGYGDPIGRTVRCDVVRSLGFGSVNRRDGCVQYISLYSLTCLEIRVRTETP